MGRGSRTETPRCRPWCSKNGLVVRNPSAFYVSFAEVRAKLADGTELRVTAPPDCNIAPGEAVSLTLPAERCRVLAED